MATGSGARARWILAGGLLLIFVALAADILLDGPLSSADRQGALRLGAARNPRLLWFFAHMTGIADKRSITALMLALSVAFAATGKRALLPGLWLGVLASAASVELLKLLFARPRPGGDGFGLASYSFPSGHSAGALVFLVLALHALWRAGWLGRTPAALVAMVLALLVGFSRVYLLVHYPTDVVAGFYEAGFWIVIATGLIGRARLRLAKVPPLNRAIAAISLATGLCASALVIATRPIPGGGATW